MQRSRSFKVNLRAIPPLDFGDDKVDSSPCGADTDFFLSTSQIDEEDEKILFSWPSEDEGEIMSFNILDDLFDHPIVPHHETQLPIAVANDSSPLPTAPSTPTMLNPKRRLCFDDDAVHNKRQCPSSPISHYRRQRIEIAELSIVAAELKERLDLLHQQTKQNELNQAHAYESLLLAKQQLHEAQQTNYQLKNQVNAILAQRNQLHRIAFCGAF